MHTPSRLTFPWNQVSHPPKKKRFTHIDVGTSPYKMPNQSQQSQQDVVDNASISQMVRDNTAITMEVRDEVRGFKRILMGEPEYKREGLVQTVDFHRKIIIMGSGVIFFLYPAWEVFKWFKPHP